MPDESAAYRELDQLLSSVPEIKVRRILSSLTGFSCLRLNQLPCLECANMERKLREAEDKARILQFQLEQAQKEADTWRSVVSSAYTRVLSKDNESVRELVNELERRGFSVVAAFQSHQQK